ncbi:MAG: hypothetical protein GY781_15215 [Gammaproteobacteria bacterium]|nr:hypothetical protein [Gammaproteobacteria bacterium]
MNKEERRRALENIESLEYTVEGFSIALRISQRDYLKALGFEFKAESFIDAYRYKDKYFLDTEHAMEYAEEHIK